MLVFDVVLWIWYGCASGIAWCLSAFLAVSGSRLILTCSSWMIAHVVFQGERIKIIEALSLSLSLLVYGYLFSSQVMYGIQEAAAACLSLAFAWLLVFFVGWQPQPAACSFAGTLVGYCERHLLKVQRCSWFCGGGSLGCLFEWEGESLLAGNSPVGTGEQATGRVDVPGEKQISAAAAASSSSSILVVHRLRLKWRMKLGRFGSPPSLVGQLPCRYLSLLVMSVWLISLRIEFICFVMGRLGGMRMGFGGGMLCGWLGVCLVGARPPPVFIPGQWTCTSCGIEGCWPSKMRCFRCLAPRPVVNGADSSRPVLGKGNARERSYPGQSSVARNPTNPTFRHLPNAGAPAPMPVGPVSSTAPLVVDLTDATTITNVLQLLAGLGVSEALFATDQKQHSSACNRQTEECWPGETTADYYW